ncbi:MAG: hypothetical protein SFW67_08915 [Myxococcaceae bacterium]|nr:hypothetical protein [Myxococcaceae bacterium]
MRSSSVTLLVVVAIANALGIVGAWADQSWGALGIAFLVLPFVNLGIAVCSSLLTPALRETPGFSVGGHLALSWSAPVGATIAAVLIIGQMGLHGC